MYSQNTLLISYQHQHPNAVSRYKSCSHLETSLYGQTVEFLLTARRPSRALAFSSWGFPDQIHLDTPQSVGLLWTSDRPFEETSTWQHTTLRTDRHPCPLPDSDSNASKRSVAAPRCSVPKYNCSWCTKYALCFRGLKVIKEWLAVQEHVTSVLSRCR